MNPKYVTDENTEVTCPECEAVIEGKKAVLQHILLNHPDLYTTKEANLAADRWIEETQITNEAEWIASAEDQKLEAKIDRMIDADIDARKEGNQ